MTFPATITRVRPGRLGRAYINVRRNIAAGISLVIVLAVIIGIGVFFEHLEAPQPTPVVAALPHTRAGVLTWERRYGNPVQGLIRGLERDIRYDLAPTIRDRQSAGYSGEQLTLAARQGLALRVPAGKAQWDAGMTRLAAAGQAFMTGHDGDGMLLMRQGNGDLKMAANLRERVINPFMTP